MQSKKDEILAYLKQRIKVKSIKYFVEDDYVLLVHSSNIIYRYETIKGIDSIKPIEFINFIKDNVIVLCFNVTGIKAKYEELDAK